MHNLEPIFSHSFTLSIHTKRIPSPATLETEESCPSIGALTRFWVVFTTRIKFLFSRVEQGLESRPKSCRLWRTMSMPVVNVLPAASLARLAATSLAGRVAEEMGVTLGEEVGYQIGGKKMLERGARRRVWST